MSAVLDPRGFKVWPISAPRKYYLERHFLVRFFERLPPRGAISVFDRSWYGRVLVERVEGLASQKDWRRAYREINEFERILTDHGPVRAGTKQVAARKLRASLSMGVASRRQSLMRQKKFSI